MRKKTQAASPSTVLTEAAKLLRRYAGIGVYRAGPGVGTGLYYLQEIREAAKWLEYAAARVDEVIVEPSARDTSKIRSRRRS